MQYITKNIIDANGIAKIQVYKVTGMTDITGKIVNIETFDGEYTKDELLDRVNKAKEQAIQSNLYITEVESKLPVKPTQAELDALIVKQTNDNKLLAIKKQKKADIDKLATLSDELNLLASSLDIVIDTIASSNPKILVNPKIIEAKGIFSKIKSILSV